MVKISEYKKKNRERLSKRKNVRRIKMKKEKIVELLDQMTLEEKIGQLVQIKGEILLKKEEEIITGPYRNLSFPKKILENVGSVLNLENSDKIYEVQHQYLEKNRLKIPLLFMADVIHGYRTIFPIPLAQGCSWDCEVIHKINKMAKQEAQLAGIYVNFLPMVDLVRDARWGRVMESMGGEDPYLGEVFARSVIKVYGEDPKPSIIACVKHFAAYGAVEAGREYNTVDMSQREFRQYYLPAYQAAIRQGAQMVMTAFTTLNGIPASVNSWLLQDLLRKELQFEGIVISDYSAIEETIAHGVCKDKKEAAYKAIVAGVDIDMMSDVYARELKGLIEEGKITQAILDTAVLRILMLKNKLGLFENPYGSLKEEKRKISVEKSEEIENLVADTFVLLKNDHKVLPLNKEDTKIALIGPFANTKEMLGAWSIYADKTKGITLKEAFEEIVGKDKIYYAKGCEILETEELNEILRANEEEIIEPKNEKEKRKELQEAITVAKQSDLILLAIGEHEKQSGEACSRANLELPNIQQQLVEELTKLGKKVVVILFSGRPLVLKNIENKVDAILQVWFPGTNGARAIADVLLGKVNPSAKLTMSFPRSFWTMSYLL